MADQLFFSRDTKVFMRRNSFFYEIPVLDGFTFNQAQNSSEITLNEAADTAGTSRRAKQVFNDSFAPAEWSFSTYIRPFIGAASGTKGTAGITDGAAANHHAVEEALWDAFVTNVDNGSGVSTGLTELTVNFGNSNKTTVGTFDLYFVLNWNDAGTATKVYKIADAAVNEASIDFDIDGIAMINWSGFGGQLTDEQDVEPYSLLGSPTTYSLADDLIHEGVSASNNYIRNKLTTLALTNSDQSGLFNATYDVVLTGGNITLSNNLTYLTPETLGSVNLPLGHVTGTRSVNGSFTAYLDGEAASTSELFEDIAESTTVVTNSFSATFSIGGAAAPNVEIALGQAHLEVPNFNVEDVMSLECTFHGLPSTIDGTDEAAIVYKGIAL